MISLLSIIALGFFLGMRHATDADHVVAVMTIVSRQRSLRPAAWVGALWGVGHTLTIVLVGSAIDRAEVLSEALPAAPVLVVEDADDAVRDATVPEPESSGTDRGLETEPRGGDVS